MKKYIKNTMPNFIHDPEFIDIHKFRSIFHFNSIFQCALCHKHRKVEYSPDNSQLINIECSETICDCTISSYYEEDLQMKA